jgi:hypothetical protein
MYSWVTKPDNEPLNNDGKKFSVLIVVFPQYPQHFLKNGPKAEKALPVK